MTRRPPILTAAAAAAALAAPAAPASAFQREASWASAEALAAARAGAPLVVVAFIVSARQPRGSSGLCPADGRVVEVERGGGPVFGDRVTALVPCAALPPDGRDPRAVRRVPMAFMGQGSYARLYFDAGRELVDYEPLQLRPAPPPRNWRAPRNN
jgi:hypothetical protein